MCYVTGDGEGQRGKATGRREEQSRKNDRAWPPRIGHASWNLTGQTLCERVRAGVDIGLNATSFLCTPGRLQAEGETEELVALVCDHDLDVTCHNALGSSDESGREARLEGETEEIASWHERTGRARVVSLDPPYFAEDGRYDPQFAG